MPPVLMLGFRGPDVASGLVLFFRHGVAWQVAICITKFSFLCNGNCLQSIKICIYLSWTQFFVTYFDHKCISRFFNERMGKVWFVQDFDSFKENLFNVDINDKSISCWLYIQEQFRFQKCFSPKVWKNSLHLHQKIFYVCANLTC